MVFYFKSHDDVILYMGKDKHENEDLIKFAFEVDVWFHASKHSSAHIYARLPLGMQWDAIPEAILQDAAQLTKANSIEGNKVDNVTIIYTQSKNLKKSGDMATGQVSFHKEKLVKKVYVKTRENAVINRLNKTKKEMFPDLEAEQRDFNIQKQREAKAYFNASKKLEENKARELKALADAKKAGYSSFLTEDTIANSANDQGYDSDDFM